jgi:DNA helicase HerA-like ATPase
MPPTLLHLGERRSVDGQRELGRFELPTDHLLTHGVIVGMTGSGKTGLVTVLVEEALRAEIPVLVVDIKGDLPNLALAFPSFDAEPMTPWVEPAPNDEDGIADPPEVARALEDRRAALAKSGIGEAELAELR